MDHRKSSQDKFADMFDPNISKNGFADMRNPQISKNGFADMRNPQISKNGVGRQPSYQEGKEKHDLNNHSDQENKK